MLTVQTVLFRKAMNEALVAEVSLKDFQSRVQFLIPPKTSILVHSRGPAINLVGTCPLSHYLRGIVLAPSLSSHSSWRLWQRRTSWWVSFQARFPCLFVSVAGSVGWIKSLPSLKLSLSIMNPLNRWIFYPQNDTRWMGVTKVPGWLPMVGTGSYFSNIDDKECHYPV